MRTVAAERTCTVCGISIEDLRPQATPCSDACRQAKRRGRPRPTISRPTCAHPATLPDDDKDPVCVLCGTLIGTPSPPNGHDATLADMVSDASGQYRQMRRKPRWRRWRDWQLEAPVGVTWVGGD